MSAENPEIGLRIDAGGIDTNYHDAGHDTGTPLLLLHGSGPGVTAWANWRLNIPALAEGRRVVAPDMVGFGYTERPAGIRYNLETWVGHAIAFLDALGIERADVVGNSYGGALALAMAIRHPKRIRRLVLMGAAGVEFELTPGLDEVWGYTPSVEGMRRLMDLFAYDRALVSDELAELRYRASIRPGYQEAFAQMFPAPRQRCRCAGQRRGADPRVGQGNPDYPWTRGPHRAAADLEEVVRSYRACAAAHVRSLWALDADRTRRALQRDSGEFPRRITPHGQAVGILAAAIAA